MKLFKRAFINLIRMPIRNALYLAIVFTMVFITVVCTRLYIVGVGAKNALDAEYPIVATVLPKSIINPDGMKVGYANSLSIDEVAILTKSDSVHSFNIRVQSGTLAPDEIVRELPDNSVISAPAIKQVVNLGYQVYAVNNLMLEQEFLDGTYLICDGERFDDDAVNYGCGGIIIPKHLSELYDLGVGDYITCSLPNSHVYLRRQIRAIYESVSGEPLTVSYITLSDHFNVIASIFRRNNLEIETSDGGVTRMYDRIQRIDICLESADSIGDFLYDARNNGFDFANYDVFINDKPYKIAESGLSQITRLSLLLMLASITAGVIVIAAVTAYCRSNRVREVEILRCLGMKKEDIRLMFVYELVGVILIGLILGTLLGAIASGGVIASVRDEYLAQTQVRANEKERLANSHAERNSAATYYPVTIRFGDSGDYYRPIDDFVKSRAVKPEKGTAIRYEKCYIRGKSEQIEVIGRSDLQSGVYTEIMSDPRGNTAEFVRIPCKAGSELGLEVGKNIQITRVDVNDTVFFNINAVEYEDAYVNSVVLTVSEVIEGDDIVLPMADLERIFETIGVYSTVYRGVRYDTVEK